MEEANLSSQKIIFLDFDGVLNSIGTKDRIIHPLFYHKIRGLDDFRVKLVSDLAIEKSADIVISSTWREFYQLNELISLLGSRGMRANIIGRTPIAHEEIFDNRKMRIDREDEIEAWMKQNGVPDYFLILDDIQTKFKDNQVKTSDGTGFFSGLLKRSRKILDTKVNND